MQKSGIRNAINIVCVPKMVFTSVINDLFDFNESECQDGHSSDAIL